MLRRDQFHRDFQAFWTKIVSDRISLLHEHTSPKDRKKWGPVVSSVNAFISRLRRLIAGISTAGFDLDRVSDRLKGSSSGILDIAHRTELQSHDLKDAMNAMSAAIMSISKSTVAVADSLSSLSKHTTTAVEVTDKSVKTMGALSGSIMEWTDTNKELVASIGRIQEIVSIIKGITDQTLIIAFNAALEASSAGEAGRRFGIVADEIRDLAMRTTGATKTIETLAHLLLEKTARSTAVMEATREKTSATIKNIGEADGDLRFISAEISRLKEMGDHISTIIEEQAGTSGRVQAAAEEVHACASSAKEAAGEMVSLSDSVMSVALRLNDNLCAIKKDAFDEELEGKVKDCTAELAALLEASLDRSDIRMEELFDEEYMPAEGGGFTAKCTPWFRTHVLPALQRWSKSLDCLIYVVVMDRNGFMPVHTNPARAGVKMSDGVSLGGAQSKIILSRAFKRPREAGGELVNDISCPLTIRGRHWGCVRIGYLPMTR